MSRLAVSATLMTIFTTTAFGAPADDQGSGYTCGTCEGCADALPDLAHAPFRHFRKQPAINLAGGGGGPIGSCTIDNSVIDVLVVYTPEAAAGAGGVPALEALIQTDIDNTNQAFINSQVNASVNLADAIQITYTESGNSGTDLNRLVTTNDGDLDDVHALRDDVRADVVCLITESANVCGIARIATRRGPSPFEDQAFFIVRRTCVGIEEYVFAHELGHVMGLMHDWNQDPFCFSGGFQFAKGYNEPGGAFKTIMAYGSEPSIQYFSNPNVSFDGMPTGDLSDINTPTDAATALNAVTAAIANFRSTDCNQNGTCDSDEIAQGDLLDCDGDGVPDVCEADQNNNGIPDDCESNDSNANGVPDDLEQAILYVNANAAGMNVGTSWSDAYSDLQDALRVATFAPGIVEEIWIADGTYTPGTMRAETFNLVNTVALYGGFAGGELNREDRDPATNLTILSGDLNGDDGALGTFENYADNSMAVVSMYNLDATAVIDGVVIRGGNADGGRACAIDSRGGGMYSWFSGATINNVVFEYNRARQGGAFVTDGFGGPVIRNSTFRHNRTFWIGLDPASSINASGAAAYFSPDNGTMTLTNVDFIGNESLSSAGACVVIAQDVRFNNCRFLGNIAGTGSGAVNVGGAVDSSTKFNNCLIAGNRVNNWAGSAVTAAGAGGAIKTPVFTNCTIANNGGGGTALNIWRPELNNCIVWNNSDASGNVTEFMQYITHALPVLNNSIASEWSGTVEGVNTFDADPLFIDPDGADDILGTADDDYRLADNSPALDMGASLYLPMDEDDIDQDGDTSELLPIDLDGMPRNVGNNPDIGAFENQNVVVLCPEDCEPDNGDGTYGNGEVNIDDLLGVINNFGGSGRCDVAPVNPDNTFGNGIINIDDIIGIINAFGTCEN
ncbi:MAG: reprolysin-like metallopeptidase [Planctomycetota bacterium]